ncbi:MAG: acyl-CoA dehydrogenase family protein [Lachnospiraceae bacterium]|nr:acyl-CoA dehydrogenase family protein [Lachnospiraceae bacterium]
MNFELSNEHRLFKRMMRDFAQNEIKPIVADVDRDVRFPFETLDKYKKYGLMGIPYPKEDGGTGADATALAIAIEEVSKVCGSSGLLISTHNTLGTSPLYYFGSEALKKKHMRSLINGEKIGAFALTESTSGSDSGEIQTRAVLEGDHYVVTGTKTFLSGAGLCDYYTTAVMTDKSKGTKGITALLIEKDTPGLSFGRIERKMGLHGNVCGEMILDKAIVPKENVLGKEGEGFKIVMSGINIARIGVGAQANGIAQGAIDETIRFVTRRKQFGKRISSFQNTQFTLADLQARTDAGRHLVYHAAWLADTEKDYMHEAAMCKYYNSRLAVEVCEKCLQLFGSYGYMNDYPIERMMRDAKFTELGEGTSEILRMVIGRNIGVA